MCKCAVSPCVALRLYPSPASPPHQSSSPSPPILQPNPLPVMYQLRHTHHPHSLCRDNRWYSLFFFPSFTLSPPHLKYAGRRLTRCLSHSPPLSLSLLHSRGSPRLSSRWKTGRRRRRRREEGRRRRWWRERARERRGGHGNGGMRRERFLSLPLFFVAVTGPQKQERVVHLQVAAVSSFIGWLWM